MAFLRMILNGILQLILPVAVIAGGVLIAQWFIYTRAEPQKADVQNPPVLVETLVARLTHEWVTVRGAGLVTPEKAIELRPEVNGRVIEQSPKLIPGGFFEKGEIIVKIDPRDYEYALEQRKAEVERATFALKEEEGRQVIAEREWKLLGDQISSTEAGKELALRQPQQRTARAALAAAESALQAAALALERTVIRAPFNAFVREEFVDPGQLVSPQTSIARLVGTDKVWVQAKIPVSELAYIHIPDVNSATGSKAMIVHESSGLQKEGRVIRLLGHLEPATREATVLIEVEDPFDRERQNPSRSIPLLVDMYVHAHIEGESLGDVVVVPRAAVHEGDVVWIMNEKNELEIREVEVVRERITESLIGSGIREGEMIVLSNIATPLPGMKLQPFSEDARETGVISAPAEITRSTPENRS